jgi:hypothetical protein
MISGLFTMRALTVYKTIRECPNKIITQNVNKTLDKHILYGNIYT